MGCRYFLAGCGVWEEGTVLLHASMLSDAGSINISIFGVINIKNTLEFYMVFVSAESVIKLFTVL